MPTNQDSDHLASKTHRRDFLAATAATLAAPLVLAEAKFTRADEPAAVPAQAADKPPVAYVLEHTDRWTKNAGEAARLLAAAGFDVRPLPLDASPREMAGLVFLGSFTSEHPGYAAYIEKNAAELYDFVDRGNVLLQMTQADQTEAAPPFLPTTHGARRADGDVDALFVASDNNPLLAGIVTNGSRLKLAGRRAGWECFEEQEGFEVILSGKEQAQQPVLMEGAYGQGRIVLSALTWDKPAGMDSHGLDDAARREFAAQFCKNLRQHVVNVANRKTRALQVTPSTMGRFAPEAWRIAVMPDTQVYSLRYPGLFDVQTTWIARNVEKLGIKYVLQLGDIVNNNTHMEWRRAAASMKILHGVVPYALVTGNHDYGPSGDASTRETHLNEYFDFKIPAAWPTFGGAMEQGKLDNSYHLFSAGGRDWIIVALEWGPRDSTIAWANHVMEKHADRHGIFMTHAYVNNTDRRYDIRDTKNRQDHNPHKYRTPGGVNDGEELWQKLVRRHRFDLTLNGHVLGRGTGYVVSKTDRGNVCQQMLSNYQMRELGGEAYLRVLEFLPDGVTVNVRTYSPLYDRFMLSPDQHFTVRLDPAAVKTG